MTFPRNLGADFFQLNYDDHTAFTALVDVVHVELNEIRGIEFGVPQSNIISRIIDHLVYIEIQVNDEVLRINGVQVVNAVEELSAANVTARDIETAVILVYSEFSKRNAGRKKSSAGILKNL